MMLRDRGVSVSDRIGRYRAPGADRIARAVVDHIELGVMADRLAWESLFTDEFRIGLHRAHHGNKPKPRRRSSPQRSLFEVPA